jgi:glyoxylase-like metal-dependent hydrolase (beta-lactamase superfamily II)
MKGNAMSVIGNVSRRDLLNWAAVGAAAAPAAALSARSAWANVAKVAQSGNLDVTIVSDGHFFLPTAFLLTSEAPPAERQNVLAMAQGERFQMPLNIALIRGGAETILVDAGYGPGATDTAGKLASALEQAGIGVGSITKVVVTHAHPDHLWGVSGESGPTFHNATYYVAGAEWNYWMSPDAVKTLPGVLRASQQASDRIVLGAQKHLTRIKDKVAVIKPDQEIISGVRVVGTPGHTPGHISVEVAGLFITADALTHPLISFQHPGWPVPVDHEPDRAIATRQKLLDRLAADKTQVIGAHLPFPGTGFVERKDGAYRFVAT